MEQFNVMLRDMEAQVDTFKRLITLRPEHVQKRKMRILLGHIMATQNEMVNEFMRILAEE